MAINFPDSPTLGPPATTHTVGDVTWTWDGTTWRAAASTSVSIATTSSVGVVKPDGTTITVTGDGTIASIASGDVTGATNSTDNALVRFDGTTGDTLQNSLITVSDTGVITAPPVGSIIPFYFDNQSAFPTADSTNHGAIAHSHQDQHMYFSHGGAWVELANSSEVGLVNVSRTTETVTTSTALTAGNTTTVDATGAKAYYILELDVSAAARVIFYVSSAARTADASRLQTIDPDPDAGVILEVVTTGAETIPIAPAVFGHSNPGANTLYVSITNNSGSNQIITVDVLMIKIET